MRAFYIDCDIDDLSREKDFLLFNTGFVSLAVSVLQIMLRGGEARRIANAVTAKATPCLAMTSPSTDETLYNRKNTNKVYLNKDRETTQ